MRKIMFFFKKICVFVYEYNYSKNLILNIKIKFYSNFSLSAKSSQNSLANSEDLYFSSLGYTLPQ